MQPATNKVKASTDSVNESQMRTTAQKKEEDSPKALSDKPSDDLQIFEEVNTCRDLLRDIWQKMSKYHATNLSINEKIDVMIKTTATVNEMATEGQNEYKEASKKDLLRKDLEMQELQSVIVDLVSPHKQREQDNNEPLLSPRALIERVESQ